MAKHRLNVSSAKPTTCQLQRIGPEFVTSVCKRFISDSLVTTLMAHPPQTPKLPMRKLAALPE
jgi:hypothetical protein